MRDGEGVRAGGVGRGQAPDVVAAFSRIKFLVLTGAIGVEVEVQRIAGQRQGVVQVNVLTLEHVFDIRGVDRRTQGVAERVAAADHVNAFQATTVAAFVALARLGVEAAKMYLQTVDLVRSQQRAGEALRQQARIIMVQHRQRRAQVAMGDHRVGKTQLQRRARLRHVAFRAAAAVLAEEVDAGGAAAAPATVQAQGVHAKRINADPHRALGEARGKVCHRALTPLGLVLPALLVVTADIGVAQEQVQSAVLDEAPGVGLSRRQRWRCARQPQNDQTCPLL